jgi:hypothetical protein
MKYRRGELQFALCNNMPGFGIKSFCLIFTNDVGGTLAVARIYSPRARMEFLYVIEIILFACKTR